ncbi:MAG TPA: CGNR zinc finger domain-containing protein [Steroidobacteraceae bacterium]|nr:CGNR zinc finger domain-containing protein [Steroidobacteraceae bacterium]
MSETLERVRACDADSCRWLFLDTSRNHTRRWCDMKVCGNRMKARRFQAGTRLEGCIGTFSYFPAAGPLRTLVVSVPTVVEEKSHEAGVR